MTGTGRGYSDPYGHRGSYLLPIGLRGIFADRLGDAIAVGPVPVPLALIGQD